MRLTVDGNSHGLSQDVAVSALESWDLAQLVELAVVIANALCRLGVDDFNVEVVGLCDGEEGGGAGVTLRASSVCGSRDVRPKRRRVYVVGLFKLFSSRSGGDVQEQERE